MSETPTRNKLDDAIKNLRQLIDTYAWRENGDMQDFVDAVDAIDRYQLELKANAFCCQLCEMHNIKPASSSDLAFAYHVGYSDAQARRKPDASKVMQW